MESQLHTGNDQQYSQMILLSLPGCSAKLSSTAHRISSIGIRDQIMICLTQFKNPQSINNINQIIE